MLSGENEGTTVKKVKVFFFTLVYLKCHLKRISGILTFFVLGIVMSVYLTLKAPVCPSTFQVIWWPPFWKAHLNWFRY